MAVPKSKKKDVQWITPSIMAVCIFLLVLLLANGQKQQEAQNMRAATLAESRRLSAIIEADLNFRIPALERMANRFERPGWFSENNFISETESYLKDMPGFEEIEWVNPEYQVQLVVPAPKDRGKHPTDLTKDKTRKQALDRAKQKDVTTLAGPVTLKSGTEGFYIVAPIYIDSELHGFIVALFNTQKWLDYVLKSYEEEFSYNNYLATVAMDNYLIYTQQSYKKIDNKIKVGTSVRVLGHQFTSYAQPTVAFVESSQTILPFVTLLFGTIFAALASISIYLLERTLLQKQRLLDTKNALKDEINERQIIQDELEEATNTLTIATSAGQIGVWAWDITEDTLVWNEYMYQIYGITPDTDVSVDLWRQSIHPDDAKATQDLLKDALEGKKRFDTEFRIVTPDDKTKYVRGSAKIVRDKNDNPIRMIGIYLDITEQKLAEQTIRHMANYDNLTDLPTRRLATDRLSVAIKQATRNHESIAIMFMDLDGFKEINDTHGHNIGDQVLVEVAKRLKSATRKSDTVARIGGDEFLAVVMNIKSNEAIEQIANKIIEAIDQPFKVNNLTVKIGISIGIAIFPEHGDDIDLLLSQADKAMYSSKKTGKNKFTYAEQE